MGWHSDISAPRRDKCVICVAPHTSNWDFIMGIFAYSALGRKANFLMKKFWFFFPLKYILKGLGGIPVDTKHRGGALTKSLVETFDRVDYMNLAVTPEGTRSLTDKWKTGFLYIAYGAKVPIQLGIIDYSTKTVIIRDEFIPTGDVDADLKWIKDYYSPYKSAAKYPTKFTTQ